MAIRRLHDITDTRPGRDPRVVVVAALEATVECGCAVRTSPTAIGHHRPPQCNLSSADRRPEPHRNIVIRTPYAVDRNSEASLRCEPWGGKRLTPRTPLS